MYVPLKNIRLFLVYEKRRSLLSTQCSLKPDEFFAADMADIFLVRVQVLAQEGRVGEGEAAVVARQGSARVLPCRVNNDGEPVLLHLTQRHHTFRQYK